MEPSQSTWAFNFHNNIVEAPYTALGSDGSIWKSEHKMNQKSVSQMEFVYPVARYIPPEIGEPITVLIGDHHCELIVTKVHWDQNCVYVTAEGTSEMRIHDTDLVKTPLDAYMDAYEEAEQMADEEILEELNMYAASGPPDKSGWPDVDPSPQYMDPLEGWSVVNDGVTDDTSPRETDIRYSLEQDRMEIYLDGGGWDRMVTNPNYWHQTLAPMVDRDGNDQGFVQINHCAWIGGAWRLPQIEGDGVTDDTVAIQTSIMTACNAVMTDGWSEIPQFSNLNWKDVEDVWKDPIDPPLVHIPKPKYGWHG